LALPHRLSTIITYGVLALLAIYLCYRFELFPFWYFDAMLAGFVLMTVTLPFDRVVGKWFNLHYAPEMVCLFGFGYFGGVASIQLPMLAGVAFLSIAVFACEKSSGNPDWTKEAGQVVIALSGSVLVGMILEAIIGF
jgi:hypothetical protein